MATLVGVSKGYLSMIANEKRQPSFSVANKIVEATRGRVKLADLDFTSKGQRHDGKAD